MLKILKLPGDSKYTDGCYGLEAVNIRGIIRIHNTSLLKRASLSLSIASTTTINFWDFADIVSRMKKNFRVDLKLLEHVDIEESSIGYVDIPFQIELPKFEEIGTGFGPCHQLLPPVGSIIGSNEHYSYNAKTLYTISSIIRSDTSIPFIRSSDNDEVIIKQFPIYDPRMIQLALRKEERKWKSQLSADPIEYDICTNTGVLTPGESIILSYKILVSLKSALMGIRVRKVSFTIRETQIIGEGRCCQKDEQRYSTWGHGRPSRIKGTSEILTWSHIEFPPLGEPSWYSNTVSPKYRQEGEKYFGLASTGIIFPGSDGIYVNRKVSIKIPGIDRYNPTTARPNIPTNDNICHLKRPRDAFFQVRHSMIVSIEMRGSETIHIEAGCYLTGITNDDIKSLFQHDIDIIPPLDYSKITGTDLWVPPYTPEDEPLKEEIQEVKPAALIDKDLPEYESPILAQKLLSALGDNFFN